MLTTDQYLRQFCRLLTADRFFGDEIVAMTTAQDSEDADEETRRIAAFRRLLGFWRLSYESAETAPSFSNEKLLASAGPPPSKFQTALLLADVLQLPEKEIAEIVAPAENSVTEMVVTARIMHASKAKGDVVIIEDEPVIASDLRYIIEQLGAKVRGAAASGKKAIELIRKHKPDLILADYNLVGEKTGVDVIEETRDDHNCPVVFITGFPEKVLEGLEGEPDVVIGKPYTLDGVRAAVAHGLTAPRMEIIDER